MNYLEKVPMTRIQSFWEEMANVITHGLGALASLVALIVLLTMAFKRGDASVVVAFGIYGLSMLLLYTFSTLYHLITNTKAKKVLRICDHVSIYLLIAGSYTPVTMLALGDLGGILLLSAAWLMAVLGIFYEVFFLGKNKAISVSFYLMMGWVAAFAFKPLMALDFDVLMWLLAGGLSYSLGVVFYLFKRMPFGHAIWHCFVLFGSTAHFICFYKVGFYPLTLPI